MVKNVLPEEIRVSQPPRSDPTFDSDFFKITSIFCQKLKFSSRIEKKFRMEIVRTMFGLEQNFGEPKWKVFWNNEKFLKYWKFPEKSKKNWKSKLFSKIEKKIIPLSLRFLRLA